MTEKESIKIEKYLLDRKKPNYDLAEKVMEAVEKQIPKKVQITDDTYPLGICPGCNVKYHPHGFKYCSECGQALDWSDEK